MDIIQAIASGFSNYFNFSGRTIRSAFWYWYLFIFCCASLIIQSPRLLAVGPTIASLSAWIYMAFVAGTLVPSIAVLIRRLHDLDRTGWWGLSIAIPPAIEVFGLIAGVPAAAITGTLLFLIGCIVLIVLCCKRGTSGPNRFGPDPRRVDTLSPAPRLHVENNPQLVFEAPAAQAISPISSAQSLLYEIDISSAARPWLLVRFAEYFMVVVCAIAISAGSLPLIASANPTGVIVFAILALNLWVAWTRIGVIDTRRDRTAIVALLLFSLLSLIVLVGTFVNFQSGTGDAIGKDIGSILFITAGLLAGLLGIVGLLWVRWSRINDIGMSFKQFVGELTKLKCAHRLERRLSARAPAAGLLELSAGILLLVVGSILGQKISGSGLIVTIIVCAAWFCILHSRACFKPSFQQTAQIDGRKPVLFLRSFGDDQELKIDRSLTAVINVSLEERFASYFHNFGPFVAIAGPSHRGVEGNLAPHLGAAMVALGDNEWQSRVHEWIQTSSLVVMFPGLTTAVGWELTQVIQTNQVHKLLLVFPGETHNNNKRVDQLITVFAKTRWVGALNKIERLSTWTVRAITFDSNGDVTVFRSKTESRDSSQLAAMVAHFLLARKSEAQVGERNAAFSTGSLSPSPLA